MKLSTLLGRTDLKEKFVLQKFLCVFLACSREELWMNMDKDISDEIIQKVLVAYKSYVEDKKPLEYILGHVDFFGRAFLVNEATLIPRPETEYMITAVTEFINGELEIENLGGKKNILLDIGTGCGVLGISVLLQNPLYFGHAIFSDYFTNALEVAKKNFENFRGEMINDRLKVDFFQSDLLQFIENGELRIENYNVILVANLPYIPEEMFEANVSDNVKKWEPKPAFVGGDDGLDYYKIMLDQIIQIRAMRCEQGKGSPKPQGSLTCFLEMMTWQVDILRQLYDSNFVFEEVKTFHFNIRIVKAWLK